MKKKVLFCLAALGAASMIFGFDSAETAESVLEKVQEAASEDSSAGMDMNMDVNIDVSLDIDDGTASSSIGVGASGSFDMEINKEPAAVSMNGDLNMSLLGQAQSMTLKMYGVTSDDGKFDTYMFSEDSASGEEGTWQHQSSDMPDLDQLLEKTVSVDFSEWGINFELASEPVTVDGKECYLLSTVMDSDSFRTMMEKAGEITEEDISSNEDVEMALSMAEGIKFKLEYYVDTASFLPVGLHMDLNDSDLSALSQYLAMAMGEMAEGSSVDLTLTDVSVDATLAYGDAHEIVVPEEALAAAESGTSEVVGNVLNEIAG